MVNDGPTLDEEALETLKWADAAFDDEGIAIRCMYIEEPSGYQCVPKNRATYASRGDYIAYLDSDNEWTPQHLEVLLAAAESGEEWPDLVYGRRKYVRDEGAPAEFQGVKLAEGDSDHVPWGPEALARLAISPTVNFIDTSDFLVSRGSLYWLAVTTFDIWNEKWMRFADWELLARAAHFGGLRFKDIPDVVSIYHITGENVQLTRPVSDAPIEVRT